MLKEARSIRSEIISTAKEEAKDEAQKILIQAQQAIQNEKRTAINELKDQVGSIAVEIAEKVLRKELESKDKQMDLVNEILKNTELK